MLWKRQNFQPIFGLSCCWHCQWVFSLPLLKDTASEKWVSTTDMSLFRLGARDNRSRAISRCEKQPHMNTLKGHEISFLPPLALVPWTGHCALWLKSMSRGGVSLCLFAGVITTIVINHHPANHTPHKRDFLCFYTPFHVEMVHLLLIPQSCKQCVCFHDLSGTA